MRRAVEGLGAHAQSPTTAPRRPPLRPTLRRNMGCAITDGDHEGSGRASIPPSSHDNARRARGRARSGERRKKGSRRPWNQARRREVRFIE